MRQEMPKKSRFALKIKLLLSSIVVFAAVSCGKPAEPPKLAAEKESSPVVESPLSKAVVQGNLDEIISLLDSDTADNAKAANDPNWN